MARKRPVLERLLEKIIYPQDINDCWSWSAHLHKSNGGRYAVFYPKHGKSVLAVRPIYEHYVGDISTGLVPDHLCKNASCVNPYHIELVTAKENILRGENPAAKFARRTHCNNGHEYTQENTRITKAGARLCRTCRRITSKEEKLRAKKKREEIKLYTL